MGDVSIVVPAFVVLENLHVLEQHEDLSLLQEKLPLRSFVVLEVGAGGELEHQEPIGCQHRGQCGQQRPLQIVETHDEVPGTSRDWLLFQVGLDQLEVDAPVVPLLDRYLSGRYLEVVAVSRLLAGCLASAWSTRPDVT